MKRAALYLLLVAVLYSLTGCHGDYVPKQKAYPRVIFPERKYEVYDPPSCPFKFRKPVYAEVHQDSSDFALRANEPCWMNMTFPAFNGTINLTYKEIGPKLSLAQLLEDAHKLSFKHTKKANYIDESIIQNSHGVSGIFYNVGGDAASNIQFFLTDSAHHFIRGSLYFYNEPNTDSMAPVLAYVRQDLDTMLSSFEWKK